MVLRMLISLLEILSFCLNSVASALFFCIKDVRDSNNCCFSFEKYSIFGDNSALFIFFA